MVRKIRVGPFSSFCGELCPNAVVIVPVNVFEGLGLQQTLARTLTRTLLISTDQPRLAAAGPAVNGKPPGSKSGCESAHWMKARDRVGGDARDRGGRSWWGRRVPVLRARARDEGERARHARWGESAPRHMRVRYYVAAAAARPLAAPGMSATASSWVF